jgi:hypothetical protein
VLSVPVTRASPTALTVRDSISPTVLSVVMSAEGGRGRPMEGPSIIYRELGFATSSKCAHLTNG